MNIDNYIIDIVLIIILAILIFSKNKSLSNFTKSFIGKLFFIFLIIISALYKIQTSFILALIFIAAYNENIENMMVSGEYVLLNKMFPLNESYKVLISFNDEYGRDFNLAQLRRPYYNHAISYRNLQNYGKDSRYSYIYDEYNGNCKNLNKYLGSDMNAPASSKDKNKTLEQTAAQIREKRKRLPSISAPKNYLHKRGHPMVYEIKRTVAGFTINNTANLPSSEPFWILLNTVFNKELCSTTQEINNYVDREDYPITFERVVAPEKTTAGKGVEFQCVIKMGEQYLKFEKGKKYMHKTLEYTKKMYNDNVKAVNCKIGAPYTQFLDVGKGPYPSIDDVPNGEWRRGSGRGRYKLKIATTTQVDDKTKSLYKDMTRPESERNCTTTTETISAAKPESWKWDNIEYKDTYKLKLYYPQNSNLHNKYVSVFPREDVYHTVSSSHPAEFWKLIFVSKPAGFNSFKCDSSWLGAKFYIYNTKVNQGNGGYYDGNLDYGWLGNSFSTYSDPSIVWTVIDANANGVKILVDYLGAWTKNGWKIVYDERLRNKYYMAIGSKQSIPRFKFEPLADKTEAVAAVTRENKDCELPATYKKLIGYEQKDKTTYKTQYKNYETRKKSPECSYAESNTYDAIPCLTDLEGADTGLPLCTEVCIPEHEESKRSDCRRSRPFKNNSKDNMIDVNRYKNIIEVEESNNFYNAIAVDSIGEATKVTIKILSGESGKIPDKCGEKITAEECSSEGRTAKDEWDNLECPVSGCTVNYCCDEPEPEQIFCGSDFSGGKCSSEGKIDKANWDTIECPITGCTINECCDEPEPIFCGSDFSGGKCSSEGKINKANWDTIRCPTTGCTINECCDEPEPEPEPEPVSQIPKPQHKGPLNFIKEMVSSVFSYSKTKESFAEKELKLDVFDKHINLCNDIYECETDEEEDCEKIIKDYEYENIDKCNDSNNSNNINTNNSINNKCNGDINSIYLHSHSDGNILHSHNNTTKETDIGKEGFENVLMERNFTPQFSNDMSRDYMRSNDYSTNNSYESNNNSKYDNNLL